MTSKALISTLVDPRSFIDKNVTITTLEGIEVQGRLIAVDGNRHSTIFGNIILRDKDGRVHVIRGSTVGSIGLKGKSWSKNTGVTRK